jgi:hypothetical protein
MRIYEYRKHLVAGRIQDPEFITNGGHWYDTDTDTYIAVMPDTVPYYMPDTLTQLTTEQLINRVQTFHQVTPYKTVIGVLGSGGTRTDTDMTNQQVAEMVTTWLSNLGIQ